MSDAIALLGSEATRLGVELPDGALDRFERYLDLIFDWNKRAGLSSIDAPIEAVRRHFVESIALLQVLREGGQLAAGAAARVADLGPGGGFPGLPMHLADPALALTLIEANQRRAEFLSHTVAELELTNVEVVAERAEDAARLEELRGTFDVVVAKALAPMNVLVEYALPLLRVGGVLATPKGSRANDDLAEGARAIEEVGGRVLPPLRLPVEGPEQTVVLIEAIRQAGDRYPRRAGIPTKRPLA